MVILQSDVSLQLGTVRAEMVVVDVEFFLNVS